MLKAIKALVALVLGVSLSVTAALAREVVEPPSRSTVCEAQSNGRKTATLRENHRKSLVQTSGFESNNRKSRIEAQNQGEAGTARTSRF